ncbi:hypothetical protein [Paracoccus jeotgali]|nr:hypothetical protein [Paracoccus jeotgali]
MTVTIVFLLYAYQFSRAVIAGDDSFLSVRSDHDGASSLVPIEPAMPDPEIFRRIAAMPQAELSRDIAAIRERLESFIAESPGTPAEDRDALARLDNLEAMIGLKAEEVASLAVIAQRVAGLENELQRTEARMQNQINNLNSLSLALFGALLVAVLGSAIWRNISLRKAE